MGVNSRSHKVISIDDEYFRPSTCYYLDRLSVIIDSDGDASGDVYYDKDLRERVGRYYLNHFKSFNESI